MKRTTFAVLLISILSLGGQAARATTVDMTFICDYCNPDVTAYGSFSYPTGLTGTLSYIDLTSFTLNLVPGDGTYDLAFTQDYRTLDEYFSYNISTNSFVPGTFYDGGDPFSSLLSAVYYDDSSGFFIYNGTITDYVGPYPYAHGDYTSLVLTVEAAPSNVPEPSSLALLGAALLGLCGMRRSRNRGAG